MTFSSVEKHPKETVLKVLVKATNYNQSRTAALSTVSISGQVNVSTGGNIAGMNYIMS